MQSRDPETVMDEIREATAPAWLRWKRAFLALSELPAQMGREDAMLEVAHLKGAKTPEPEQEAFAEPSAKDWDRVEKATGIATSKRFLPDTLAKRLAGRSLTWANVTQADLLGQIQGAVMEGLTSGAGDTASLTARLDDVFNGWIDDGTVDPTTGMKLTKPHKIEQIARTQAMAAYNAGRMDLINDPEVEIVEAVEYSAILDGRTSKLCSGWDGTVLAKTPENEATIAEMNPPNHAHCRSFWLPVIQGEEWDAAPRDDWPTAKNKDGDRVLMQPQRGFGVIPGAKAD